MMWKFTMAGISIKELGVITGITAAGIGMMVKKMVDSFSVIDRVKRQFTSIYQSAELGAGAVDFLTDAAAKIRYSIIEVLDAGRLLAMEGFAPKDLIYDMADLAAGVNQQGITIVNATRAFVDATNGQFRRLKETFQVTREDAMKFDPFAFSGPNNQITNQARATEAIIKAVRAKYKGMNDATMQTIQGQLSNVDDAIIKALAPLGKSLAPTLFGWFDKFFELMKKIEAFGKTGLGGATAQTLLWTTILLGSVSAVSLLAAGMTSLLGVFAAYKVFVGTREKGVLDILKAEVQLMAVHQEMAAIEAMRNSEDISSMKLRLNLSKALYFEEQKRLSLIGAPVVGTSSTYVRATPLESLTANRIAAQAALETAMLPQQILAIEDKITAARAAEVGLSVEQLDVMRLETTELERQLVLMREKWAAAQQTAGVSTGGGVVANRGRDAYIDKINAESSAAGAARRLQQAQQNSAAATNVVMNARRSMSDANVDANLAFASLQTKQIINGHALLVLEKAQTAEQQAQLKYETDLAALETVRKNALSPFIVPGMPRVPGRIAFEKGFDPALKDAAEASRQQLIASREELIKAHRAQRAAASDLASKPIGAAGGAGDAAERATLRRLEYEEAITAQKNAQAKLASAQQAKQEAETAAVQAQAAYQTELQAALATRPKLAAEYAAIETQITRLKAMEAKTEAEIADTSNLAGAAEQRQLAAVRARIVALEQELALRQGNLATATATAGADRVGALRTFGGGFRAGAGALLGGILSLFEGIASMIAAPFAALGSAIVAAEATFIGIVGVIAGFAAVLVAVIGAGWLLERAYKYNAQALKSFRDNLDEASTKLKTWTGLLPTTPAGQSAEERANAMRTAQGKMGQPGPLGDWQGWDEAAKEYAMRLIPGYGAYRAISKGPVPGYEGDTTNFGQRLLKSQEGDVGKAGALLVDMIAAARASGNVPEALKGMTPEMAKGLDANALNKLKLTEQERMQLEADIDTYLRKQTRTIENQGFMLDRQALQWAQRKIDSGELTAEEVAQYKAILSSTQPAKDLQKYLKDSFRYASDAVPELNNIQDAMEEGLEAGKDDTQIQAELKADRDTAQKQLNEMVASLDAQRAIGLEINNDDQKRVQRLQQQLDVLKNIEATYNAITSLRISGEQAGILGAAGMGNLGAVFGGANAASAYTAGLGSSGKQRQQYLEQAYKEKASMIADLAAVDLALAETGPGAGSTQKAAAAQARAGIYRRQAASTGNLMGGAVSWLAQQGRPEEAAQAQKNMSAQIMALERKAVEEERAGQKLLADDQIAALENQKRAAAQRGQQEWELLNYDLQILRIKQQQAVLDGDANAAAAIALDYADKQKSAEEARRAKMEGTNNAWFQYMQALNENGMIGDEAVDAARQKMAQFYQWMANQYPKGSQEWYQNMSQALGLLKEETDSGFDAIIGKIIGAPSDLIGRVVSEGGISKRFGNMADLFGMNGKMQAEIVSQSNRELLVRVNFDSALQTVDDKIRAVMPSAINAMGQQLVGALSA